jgi:hypothetical protein
MANPRLDAVVDFSLLDGLVADVWDRLHWFWARSSNPSDARRAGSVR